MSDPPGPPPQGRILQAAVAGVCLAVIFAVHFGGVKATNFGGHDEWLILSLTARGRLAVPYANRPLVLLWQQPAPLLFPGWLGGFALASGSYLLLGGLFSFALCRQILPRRLTLAVLAALFCMTWVPLDFIRLDTVLVGGYAGSTAAVLLAVLLLTVSWERRSGILLLAAALLGFLAARVVEVVIPLLLAAPVLLLLRGPRGRTLGAWIAAWESPVLLAAAAFALPLYRTGGHSYQLSALGAELSPIGVATRLAQQFGFHLLPLVEPPRELWEGRVAMTVALALALIFGLAAAELKTASSADERRQHLLAAAGGLVWATLAYLPFALTPSVKGAGRTQILAAPGIGLFLAGLVCGLAGRLPLSARRAAVAVLACWVVGVGTGRTLALQHEWDRASSWPEQSRTLRGLLRSAPDFAPNTFVLLIDEGGAWPATFTFRHAVEYVYGRHVVAAVWGVPTFLYESVFTPEGVLSIPWEVIRQPWDVQVTRHRYDEIVLVRRNRAGEVSLLEEWPPGLPALPPGTAYTPHTRVLPRAATGGHREILGQGGVP